MEVLIIIVIIIGILAFAWMLLSPGLGNAGLVVLASVGHPTMPGQQPAPPAMVAAVSAPTAVPPTYCCVPAPTAAPTAAPIVVHPPCCVVPPAPTAAPATPAPTAAPVAPSTTTGEERILDAIKAGRRDQAATDGSQDRAIGALRSEIGGLRDEIRGMPDPDIMQPWPPTMSGPIPEPTPCDCAAHPHHGRPPAARR